MTPITKLHKLLMVSPDCVQNIYAGKYTTALQPLQVHIQCDNLRDSRTSEILDLNKYATKTLGNDCFVDLVGGKLCLSYRLAVISEKMFASYVFPDKNQKPLCMCRMQITKEAVAILPLISGSY